MRVFTVSQVMLTRCHFTVTKSGFKTIPGRREKHEKWNKKKIIGETKQSLKKGGA